MKESDEEGYFRFMEDTNKREMSNSETYDNALLTLSSVLLGLSLTFTQNIVLLQNSNNLWLLLCSWGLFALTIIMVIASFIYGQHAFKRLKAGARLYYLEGETSTNQISEKISNSIRIINTISGVSFIIAVVLFTIFVAINVNGGNIVRKEDKLEEKIQSTSTYEQHESKPTQKPKETLEQKPKQDPKK